jgi:hypothetical protein
MAFDSFADKNAVFRRLKAKPENKVPNQPPAAACWAAAAASF